MPSDIVESAQKTGRKNQVLNLKAGLKRDERRESPTKDPANFGVRDRRMALGLEKAKSVEKARPPVQKLARCLGQLRRIRSTCTDENLVGSFFCEFGLTQTEFDSRRDGNGSQRR